MDSTIPLAPPAEPPQYYRLLAPWWHTVILIVVLLALSFGQAHNIARIVQRHGHLPLYISTILFEWTMVAFVWLGIRGRGIRLRDLVGGKWKSPEDFLLDLAIAVGFWVVSGAILFGIQYALGLVRMHEVESLAKERLAKIGFLLPETRLDMVFYAALAVTAGFCEELIFRGYLQKQFHAATHSVVAGVFAQGILFGCAHGYQGTKLMIVLSAYGCLFGALAALRGSLRPGMMTHAGQDLLAGFVGRIAMHQLR